MSEATTPRVRPAMVKRTDLGNAQRLAARYAEVVRHVAATQTWHIWDGTRWAPDTTGQIERFARDTVRAMQREADGMEYDDGDEKVAAVKWAVASENAARLANMVALARSEPGIAVEATVFDSQPWELNTPAGIIDLRTGERRNHDPAAMHSQVTAAKPGGAAPQWHKFLRLVLPDKQVRLYVQKLLGASLVGAPLPGATFPFVYGEGGTGKSTLLEPVLAALGDYGRLAPANLLVAKRGSGGDQTYDIAALRGKRFVLASEGHSHQRLAEEVVKRVTGDATLAGRQIREAELTFPNVTALWFMSNHEPRVSATDTGLWRRIKEIPMDVVLGPEHARLKERLIEDELDGIMKWLIAGCVASQADGLEPPKQVLEATASFRDDANSLLEWAAACCTQDADHVETAAALHDSYVTWANAARRYNEYPSGRSKAWARALRSLGLEQTRSTTQRGWKGLRLNQPGM